MASDCDRKATFCRFVTTVVFCGMLSAQTVNGLWKAQSTSAPQETPVDSRLRSDTANSAASTNTANAGLAVIGAGDLLEVSVVGVPDYLKQARVGNDGRIELPLLGPVEVAGLTIEQAQQLVRKELSERRFFNDPQVSIFEKEYATQGIAVLGEVQHPGTYLLLGQHTLFEAISVAGGTTARAGSTALITHRSSATRPESVNLEYDTKNSPRSNVPVFPGDTVIVSKAGMVYVVGDVKNPSGIVMQDKSMTVLQAIAMARGTNPTAKLDGAKLIRKSAQGPQELALPLKKILTAKAPDVTLVPDDIIFVPGSSAKVAGQKGLEAIIQAATGAAIYRP